MTGEIPSKISWFTKKSGEMMASNFQKITYQYAPIPSSQLSKPYGIYVNVPFCEHFCTFCPFYKEIYDAKLIEQYINAITKEIRESQIKQSPEWIYFGGGTPNILTITQLQSIITALEAKIPLKNLGIELSPKHMTPEYLEGLIDLNFSKISIGIESFNSDVLTQSGRTAVNPNTIKAYIRQAKTAGIFVNLDLMVGLQDQKIDDFIVDIRSTLSLNPSQITIYPYMLLRENQPKPVMTDYAQFMAIEEAWKYIRDQGYSRRGPWTFTNENDLYDSSRDELVDDYIGFGPAAFSTYGGYKIVNPPAKLYIKNQLTDNQFGLIAPVQPDARSWRQFAHGLSDLHIKTQNHYPKFLKFLIRLLAWLGYTKNNKLTGKGILFAHSLMKTVVEALPFPLQNETKITNYIQYRKELDAVDKKDIVASYSGINDEKISLTG